MILHPRHPLAVAVVTAIREGDVPELARLLAATPGLATARVGDENCGTSRSLLHVATDWPGHFPDAVATVRALVAAGADVNARFTGTHQETPLHWAASSDDVDVLDALLDAGADIEAGGGVIGGGTPLCDARTFGQWRAARRLVERGAATTLVDEASLGLMDRIERRFHETTPPDIDEALWGACHGGQRIAAEYLLDHGADPSWIPGWEPLTAADIARRAGFDELAEWIRSRGGRTGG